MHKIPGKIFFFTDRLISFLKIKINKIGPQKRLGNVINNGLHLAKYSCKIVRDQDDNSKNKTKQGK